MELSTAITKFPSIGPAYAGKLERLNIFTVEDLLNHTPARYQDFRNVVKISELSHGQSVTVQGNLDSIKNIYTKYGKKLQVAKVSDATGEVTIVWFNQTYLAKNLKLNEKYSFSGRVGEFNNKVALVSPDFEYAGQGVELIHTARLVPMYPATYGVSSKWLRTKVHLAMAMTKGKMQEFLPTATLKKYNLLSVNEAYNLAHFPHDLEAVDKAVERLGFNELLFHHLASLKRKNIWQENKVAHKISLPKGSFDEFTRALPFQLTNSQLTAIAEVEKDLLSDKPMNRLLEGDVGSGKTVVAAFAAFCAFACGYQTVFMAPTQILAEQHFNTLNKLFANLKVRVSLITASMTAKPLGKTDIFVGTHALIHKSVNFDSVAVVVIDEQHRFGVEQRAHLISKAKDQKYSPNVLTMTATPIPRTIALTLYGDLDLSVLSDMPKGRQKVTTWLLGANKRAGAYAWITQQIKREKVQVFIVCPLIDESEAETMKSVKAVTNEFLVLKDIFKGCKLGLLHGRQKAKEKTDVLNSFRSGKIDILVATPVVEVGIDVANATIMIIEGGERYGLAQLHQLRGRIGRGGKKSYCMIFTTTGSKKSLVRLRALCEEHSGFELAELDLKLRGPGDVFGLRQHGFNELKIASWSNTDQIKTTRSLAEDIIKRPKNYPEVMKKMGLKNATLPN